MKNVEFELDGKQYKLFDITKTKSVGECERKYFEFRKEYGNSACSLDNNTGVYTVFGMIIN